MSSCFLMSTVCPPSLRIKNDLQYCTGKIPNISKQLKLVASVKLQSLAQTDVSVSLVHECIYLNVLSLMYY